MILADLETEILSKLKNRVGLFYYRFMDEIAGKHKIFF